MTEPARQTAPYGAWPSPISSAMMTAGRVGLSEPRLDGADVYWCESRPWEKGRTVIVRRSANGTIADVLPAGFDARDRVHEYGGGAYDVRDGVVVFSNRGDDRLYRIDDGGEPRPITGEGAWRYADLRIDAGRNRVVCVREDHAAGGDAVNTLVAVSLAGEAEGGTILAEGADFYSTPRLAPDGGRLAWLSWNHPNMPW
ncbi:MAG TPA: hypothetical protein VFU81_02440, partial [Thermomicrobiales bacterium]|nr:hypothetical protein [Thermomicrobiales bacterium]